MERRKHVPGVKRLSIAQTAETATALKELADRQGISLNQAINRAVIRDRLLMDEIRAGNDLLFRDPSGNIREVVIADFEILRERPQ